MASRGVTVEMLQSALSNNNKNDGAGRVRDGEEALLVRAEGRLRSLEEIRSVVIAARDTGIVRVGDVAEVRNGALPRNGVVVRNGEGEAVWGLVLGLRGADARMVVKGVKERLAEIEPTLPKGAKIEIFYDRSELIGKAVWTVQKVLIEAIVLVVILLVLVPWRSSRRDRRVGHFAARRALDIRHHALVGPLGEHHVARRSRDRHRTSGRLRGRRRRERRTPHGACA